MFFRWLLFVGVPLQKPEGQVNQRHSYKLSDESRHGPGSRCKPFAVILSVLRLRCLVIDAVTFLSLLLVCLCVGVGDLVFDQCQVMDHVGKV